jgi:DNA-binding MarR family transcriptional regulator
MQALILINIGHNTLTIGELTSKGYYSGSNSSYNVRKMTIGGYISHQPSEHDKRACYITLSEKGKNLYNKLMKNLERYMHIFSQDDGKSDILRGCAENLKKITTAWKENLEH